MYLTNTLVFYFESFLYVLVDLCIKSIGVV
jgi:hypothetical protein